MSICEPDDIRQLGHIILWMSPACVAPNEYAGDFGEEANAQLIINDANSLKATQMTVLAFGETIKSFYLSPTGFGGWSLEMIISHNAVNFYNRLPRNIGRSVIEKHAIRYPQIGRMLRGELV